MSVSTKSRNGRAWAEVDLGQLIANARTIQATAGCDALLPMIKAEAYGLGAHAVAKALEPLDPWGFGLATVDEAIALRHAGVKRRLMVFTPAHLGLGETYAEFDLTAVVDDPDVAAQWPTSYHVEVDTGMGRCGVRWDDRGALLGCGEGRIEGVFTHFHSADEDLESVGLQWDRFERALAHFPTRPAIVHAANSAAAWRLNHKLDLVRPGIFLYGGWHGSDLPSPEPVVSVRAPIVSLRHVPVGESVSYGATWIARRPTTVATIGIGYADGFSRTASGRAEVVVCGKRRPVVGRVTMDFVMVALDDGDEAAVGDVATVVGVDGSASISIDEYADWAGTNAYEALARLGARVPRYYVGG